MGIIALTENLFAAYSQDTFFEIWKNTAHENFLQDFWFYKKQLRKKGG